MEKEERLILYFIFLKEILDICMEFSIKEQIKSSSPTQTPPVVVEM